MGRLVIRAWLLLAGLGCVAVAALLAGTAGWMQLAAVLGPVAATAWVAGGVLAAGVVLLALAARWPRPRGAAAAEDEALRAILAEAGLQMPEPGQRPPVVEAFLFGLTCALRLGRGARR